MGAFILAAYSTHLNHQLHHQLMHNNAGFLQELAHLKQQQKQAEEQFITDAHAMNHDLNRKVTAIDKQLNEAITQRFYQNQDWLLLKVRYYLELAKSMLIGTISLQRLLLYCSKQINYWRN